MLWRIPLADVDFDEEEYAAVESVLKSKWLTMGSVTQAFEADFCALTGIEHAIAVTNCTAGLHLAVAILGIGPGDEVIVPSLSFVATANAVMYTGATPVFADVHGVHDLTISPDSILEALTPRTKAVIVMHYGGYPCDMERIQQIAREHGLFVIEDAAHALGAYLKGESLGGWGDVGCFSFFPNKNITTAEGGMVTTNNPELAHKIHLLRSHGMTSLTWDRHAGHAWSYDVVELGYNYRIDEIRSALGISQLKKLKDINQKRQGLTEEYWKTLQNEVPEIEIPFIDHRGTASFHILPILLPPAKDRLEIMEMMKRAGIQTSIHYPPIHRFSYYQEQYPGIHLEQTQEIASRELTLPLHPGMSLDEVHFVVNSLRESLR